MVHEAKNFNLWMVIGLLVISSKTALASGQSSLPAPSNMFTPNVVAFSAGPAWEHAGSTQTFYLNPGIEKTYAANNATHALADVEIFVGKQWRLHQHVLSQLGLAFASTSNAQLSGNIWDDADPAFNNYTYRYKIQHTHLAAKGKLIGDWGYIVSPWISASLGVGFNRANSYVSVPTIFEAVPMPGFESQTQVAFTYTIGAGIQTRLTQNWLIGIGYEFADWGSSQLDRAQGQTEGNGLALNHLYTNSIMLNLTNIS
jgi:opacity protein-like surface antigen